MEGLSFDRDAIKKKKVSPEQLVQDLVGKGLIKGAIVFKQDKVVFSEFAEGGTTMMTALGLKLLGYLRSLSRNLGQHNPQSFAALGDKVVVVMMRSRVHDSLVFVGKEHFRDAIEQWKTKMKAFESG